MIVILGYLAAVSVGLTLGILGAGGAILTVPIMVYLLDVNPVQATVYSLFIVGTTTFIGSISYIKKGLINFKTSLSFAIPSLISIFTTRKFILPAIPLELYNDGSFIFTKDTFVISLFAVIMLLSSFSMIRGGVKENAAGRIMHTRDYVFLVVYGLAVGLITGMVGAGGGFLIVPALVLIAKIPVKEAIGTSLIIISMNSISGFIGDLTGDYVIDWELLLIFLALSTAGILIGSYLVKFISPKRLKLGFGWFVLFMGCYILIKEIIF
jgi:uncharacterized membrane protein YfcA